MNENFYSLLSPLYALFAEGEFPPRLRPLASTWNERRSSLRRPRSGTPIPLIAPVSWGEYQRPNPHRRADWRWSRAWAIVRYGRYVSRDRDDSETGRAVRFLRDLIRKPQDTAVIKERYPDLVTAHSIYSGPPAPRQELEARLLARQSAEKIADKLAVSSGTVAAYIDTFFDVGDRLDAGMYVSAQILRPAWSRSPAEGLLMTVAYRVGPAVLEAVLPLLRDDGRELRRLTSRVPVEDTLAERLTLLLRARQLPNDEKTEKVLMRRYRDLLATFPLSEANVDLIGAFSQIVAPFSGNLESKEAPTATNASRAA